MITMIPWARRRGEGGAETGGLLDLRSEMDRLFDHFIESPFAESNLASVTGAMPALEIYDQDNHLVVEAEVPGMEPDDIEISVSGDELVIAGEKREESEQKRDGLYRTERRYGRFRRVIGLPNDVNAEDVTADYSNGVLTLRIPRTEPKQAKRIEVKSGSGRKQMKDQQGESRAGSQSEAKSSKGQAEHGKSRSDESGGGRRSR